MPFVVIGKVSRSSLEGCIDHEDADLNREFGDDVLVSLAEVMFAFVFRVDISNEIKDGLSFADEIGVFSGVRELEISESLLLLGYEDGFSTELGDQFGSDIGPFQSSTEAPENSGFDVRFLFESFG